MRKLDVSSETLDVALLHLERVGLLQRSKDVLWASPAVRRLDEIDLIGV
jgi:hypothetical protein